MSMFPGAGAVIEYNEAGEPTGWDYPSEPDMGDVEQDWYAVYDIDDEDDEDEDDDTFIGSETSSGGDL